MWGWRAKASAIDPTAYGRGSSRSRAPAWRAATVPAPNGMPPWVTLGPSSTTSTRASVNDGPGSSVTGDAALTIVAVGFVSATTATTSAVADSGAVSTLLTTTMSAVRRLISPGW